MDNNQVTRGNYRGGRGRGGRARGGRGGRGGHGGHGYHGLTINGPMHNATLTIQNFSGGLTQPVLGLAGGMSNTGTAMLLPANAGNGGNRVNKVKTEAQKDRAARKRRRRVSQPMMQVIMRQDYQHSM